MIEPSAWQSSSVFASFYLSDHQHALAGLRSLGPFWAAGGRIRLFSPLSTLVGGGGVEKILVHSNPFTYFVVMIVFYFLNCIVLYTVIVFPAPALGGLWLSSDFRSVGLFLAYATELCRLLACCQDSLFPAGFRTIDIVWLGPVFLIPGLLRRCSSTCVVATSPLVFVLVGFCPGLWFHTLYLTLICLTICDILTVTYLSCSNKLTAS